MAGMKAETLRALAFTGSRPKSLYGEHDRRAWSLLCARIEHAVESLDREQGIGEAWSGGAQGADMACFTAVARHNRRHAGKRILNMLAVPFPGQERRWPENGMFGTSSYRRMVADADEVVTVSAKASRQAYMRRNMFMVSRCDLLLAVSRADPSTAKTGTGSTVRRAMSLGRPVFWLEADSGNMKRLNP